MRSIPRPARLLAGSAFFVVKITSVTSIVKNAILEFTALSVLLTKRSCYLSRRVSLAFFSLTFLCGLSRYGWLIIQSWSSVFHWYFVHYFEKSRYSNANIGCSFRRITSVPTCSHALSVKWWDGTISHFKPATVKWSTLLFSIQTVTTLILFIMARENAVPPM